MNDDINNINILSGLAEGMEKTANIIAKEEQQIRDSIQPLGNILSDNTQEFINTVTSSLLNSIKHLRDTASQIKEME